MSLINDLDAEIALAVLVEKKHNEKLETKEIIPLIGRLNKALEQVQEKEDKFSERILTENPRLRFAA